MTYVTAKFEVFLGPKLTWLLGPNKNMRVSGNGYENFRYSKAHIFFFWKKYNLLHFERHGKNIILCILKGILPFKMQ